MKGNEVVKLAPDELTEATNDDLCRGYAVAMRRGFDGYDMCRLLEAEAVRRKAYGLFAFSTFDEAYWLKSEDKDDPES